MAANSAPGNSEFDDPLTKASDLTPMAQKQVAVKAGVPKPLAAGGGGKLQSDDENAIFTIGYSLVGLGQLASAVFCAATPRTAADWVFGASGFPLGPRDDILMRLLAAGLSSGATTAFTLAELSREGRKDTNTAIALRGGLAVLGASTLALAFANRDRLTTSFLTQAALAGGVSFGLPALQALGTKKTRKETKDALKSAPKGIGRLFDFAGSGIGGILNAVLTPGFMLAGALYTFNAPESLSAVLGPLKTAVDTVFLWRVVGGALLSTVPAITATLKHKGDRDMMDTRPAKILNTGLLASALGHIAVLAPLLYNGEGGDYLPAVLGTWAAAALAATVGLAEGNRVDKEA